VSDPFEARLLEAAENANTYTALGPRDERIENDRYVLYLLGDTTAAHGNVAQRFRLRPETVETTLEEIRGLLRERSRPRATWEVGSSATPPDLVDRLLGLGLEIEEGDIRAMVLTEPLADPPPADVVARPVESVQEYRLAQRLAGEVFGDTPEAIAERDAQAEEGFARQGRNQTFLAFVDGEPVAMGVASYADYGVTLFGGSTRPEARGRGAYRALVAARWEEAKRRGTPALVTQASPMSKPILERLGFREVARITILLDEFGG
jgi:GNAT superfamily N-acetyltransferase